MEIRYFWCYVQSYLVVFFIKQTCANAIHKGGYWLLESDMSAPNWQSSSITLHIFICIASSMQLTPLFDLLKIHIMYFGHHILLNYAQLGNVGNNLNLKYLRLTSAPPETIKNDDASWLLWLIDCWSSDSPSVLVSFTSAPPGAKIWLVELE